MASGNETDMVVFPQGLQALQEVAKEVGLALRGAELNLGGGFDAVHHRKSMLHGGLIPNMKEYPRNRMRSKRSKRLFNAAIHPLRLGAESTVAWKDTLKRQRLRCERNQQ